MKTQKLWKGLAVAAALSTIGIHMPMVQAHNGELDHDTPKELMAKVKVDQKIDSALPLSAQFKDENGKTVRLGEYFGKKPVLMMFIAYSCTQLCVASFEALQPTLEEIPFAAGKDYEIVVASIDPRDTTGMAKAHWIEQTQKYGTKGDPKGWHFLTGSEQSIKAVTQSVGFGYALNPATKEYVHPDAIVVTTPSGHVSRYFYRLEYPARDLKFGLMEASRNKLGTPLDYVALQCFHYNPVTGKYSVELMKILRAAGTLTVLGMALSIFLMVRSDKKRNTEKLTPQQA